MTFYVENESKNPLEFDYEKVAKDVMEETLEYIKCPYETEISLLLTDNEEIKLMNLKNRNIDKETDVLSFPNIVFETHGDLSHVEDMYADYFNPETDELILGDIVISVEKLKEQAVKYEHSEKREFAFLVAHSMFHLFGYDHETSTEAEEMENMQTDILKILKIERN
jgi:probable rRNA maturation factor